MNKKIYLLVVLVFVVIEATMAAKCKKQLKACNADKADQATEIATLKAENADQATEIDALKAENADQATEIKELNAKIDELQAECSKCYKSCKEAYDDGQREDKAYTLCLDSGEQQVYCRMSDIDGCGSGGFTLVMKIDGHKQTFSYDEDLWSNKEVYNVAGGISGFDGEETKLSTYWESPFSKICLGMEVGNDRRFISIDQEADSLYSLIADGQYRATSIGRDAWKSLIDDSSLQTKCNREGFNAQSGSDFFARVRIGITNNEVNDCDTNDSRLGFGGAGSPDTFNSCGNPATWFPDNGIKYTKANGYILVQ